MKGVLTVEYEGVGCMEILWGSQSVSEAACESGEGFR